jgi:hypothetical protein
VMSVSRNGTHERFSRQGFNAICRGRQLDDFPNPARDPHRPSRRARRGVHFRHWERDSAARERGVGRNLRSVSYGWRLILGLPAHLALERSGLTSLWHYLVAGAMLGTLVPVVVATVLEQIALLSPAALLLFGLSGAMVAAAFRAFACWPARSANSHIE